MAKRIELKREKLSKDNGEKDFDYAKTIIMVLSKPGGNGLDMEDIRVSMKIINRLNSSENGKGIKTSFVVEDSEWDYLNKKIKAFRWAISDDAILNLGDAIKNAVNVEIGS